MSNDAKTSPLPLGDGPGVRAVGNGKRPNPYAQVALTYIRRPFASWPGRLMSAYVLVMLLVTLFQIGPAGRCANPPWPFMLMPYIVLFWYLADHMKEQFADSRAALTPGFRRVHATVATAVVLAVAVLWPALLTWLVGLRSVGLVAFSLLLFGTILWLMLMQSAWPVFFMLAGWIALFTESGRGTAEQLLSGQFEAQTVALLVLGAVVTLLAGIRLLRLNEDMPRYHTRTQWDWTGMRPMNRQAWTGQRRLLPGLGDWLAERQMARLTRHARRASASWWSRICRWQVGMVAGWSFWLLILSAVLYIHILSWWIPTKPSRTAFAMLGITSYVQIFVPVMATIRVFSKRVPMIGYELLMPVDRKTYVRQLGAAAALSHLQLWAGMSIALVLSWLLAGPRPLQSAMLAGEVALSGAFQVGAFGVLVWTARYRSRWLFALATGIIFSVVIILQMRWRFISPSDQLLHEVIWVAGIIASLGLLITFDAYRRWLAADFN